MAEPIPRLLHFRISHYNEKVRWALDYKRCPHVRQALVPAFHVPVVRRLTGQNKVPVVEIAGQTTTDSSRILAEIERLHPDPPLYPSDPAELARALAIAEYFDDEVGPELRRIFWSAYLAQPRAAAAMATASFGPLTRWSWLLMFPLTRVILRANMGIYADQLAAAHAGIGAHFDRLEAEIGPSGYLVGDSFSIADLSAAAMLTPIVRPPEFAYLPPEPVPAALDELRAAWAHRPGFRWVLDMYARHRGSSSEIPAT